LFLGKALLIGLFSGLFGYFGAALAGVAHHSWKNNEKHNPGEPLHWSMDKSNDHVDCIQRHLLDAQELLVAIDRTDGETREDRDIFIKQVLEEADALAWRALALSQTLRMRYADAPVPCNAKQSNDATKMVGPGKVRYYRYYSEAGLRGYPGSLRNKDGSPA
jgi:hypothetical protein